jgi:protein SCO1
VSSKLIRSAGVVVLLAWLAGCGTSSSPRSEPGHAHAATSVPRAVSSTSGGAGYRGLPTLGSSVATDFALTDQTGKTVRLSRQRGRIVLLTFLYTRCPDVCPLIAENLNQALRSLGRRRMSLRVIAVSVDPAHDTRQAVRQFVRVHRLLPQFRYLTGTSEQLRPIWQSYNLLVEIRNVERVSHSAYILLIDRSGRPRLYYPSTVDPQAIVHDLKIFLRK